MAQIRRLNTLRGAAALIVVVSHFSNATGAWGKLLGQGAGQLGVMLFFMLSGFLMSHLYWRREPSNRNLLRFFEARVARVLPLYIAVVLLSFFSGWPYDIATGPALASHLLFLSGVSVLWTIPPEIQFYVLFGLAWRFLGRRSGAVLASMAVIFVGLYFLNFPSGKVEVLGLTVSAVLLKALPYFMVGALLGYAYQPLLPRLQGRRHAYLLSAIVVLLLFPNIFALIAGKHHSMWRDVGVLMLMSLAFFGLVFMTPDGNRILENALGDFFGKISYSLYLLHLPVMAFVLALELPLAPVLQLALVIALATAVAYLSFRLVEDPARRGLRGRFTAQGASAAESAQRGRASAEL